MKFLLTLLLSSIAACATAASFNSCMNSSQINIVCPQTITDLSTTSWSGTNTFTNPANSFIGNGSGLTGLPVDTTKLNKSSFTFYVATAGGDYATLSAAVTAVNALNLSTSSRVTFFIQAGNYTESPVSLPGNYNITGLGRPSLSYASASPAITLNGSNMIENITITNTLGGAFSIGSTSATSISATLATGLDYGVQVSSGFLFARDSNFMGNTGCLQTGSNSLGASNVSCRSQLGGGNALLQTGTAASINFSNSVLDGATGFSTVKLRGGTTINTIRNTSICAKTGQLAIDATNGFTGTGGVYGGLITFSNSCMGGGGLSKLMGSSVTFTGAQSISGVEFPSSPIANAYLKANSTGSAVWESAALTLTGAVTAGSFVGSGSGVTAVVHYAHAGGFSSTLNVGTTFFAFTPDEAVTLKRITATVIVPGVGGAGDTYRCQDASGNNVAVTVAAAAAAGTVTTATGTGAISSTTQVNGLLYDSTAVTSPVVNLLCEYTTP